MYKRQGYGTGLHPNAPYVAVKVPVFSFEKLHAVDTQFGPEMKSTGEVLGIAPNYHCLLYTSHHPDLPPYRQLRHE